MRKDIHGSSVRAQLGERKEENNIILVGDVAHIFVVGAGPNGLIPGVDNVAA